MITRRRVQLPAPYPPVNIAETANPATGEIRYRFKGPRAAGTILINPELRGAEPIPTAVHLTFGEYATRDHERPHRPVINGVTLVGGVILDPAEYLASANHTLWLHRATGPYTSIRVPDATNRYGSAVIHALVRLWHTRPDRDELILTAARRTARHRLHELHRSAIAPIKTRIEELEHELLDHLRHATALYELARQHDALNHDTPETTP
ncbi:hypothetical protein [Actinoplanes sp. NPDC051851]|uniref:hypothetical protein n=1 Tax=Actinoplanes sp. NPDC051851 TaxID=3154753 RepID=UPI00341E473A